jgi:hypothetical protein
LQVYVPAAAWVCFALRTKHTQPQSKAAWVSERSKIPQVTQWAFFAFGSKVHFNERAPMLALRVTIIAQNGAKYLAATGNRVTRVK